MIVDPLALKEREPGRGGHILAPVLVPFDVELGRFVVAQDFGGHERADVEAHPVVEVGVPADGLQVERFPAYENIVGGFAFEDAFEPCLEIAGGGKANLGAVHAVLDPLFLSANPVTEVGVDEPLQILGIQCVVIDQRREAVLETVPNVPDEGAMVEALAMLLEELFAQPDFEGFAGAVGIGQ